MFKYVRIWQNDKKLDEWAKKVRKEIKNERLLEAFEVDFSQIKKTNEFTRASFVMYWEIQTNSQLATLAPPLVQATLVSMTNRLVEMERMDEAQVVNANVDADVDTGAAGAVGVESSLAHSALLDLIPQPVEHGV